MAEIANEIGKLLRQKGLTLGTVESATGGLIAHLIICVADTGIAGPEGATPGKPVGLFYLGLAHQGGVFNRKLELHGTRLQNKKSAAEAALKWVKEYLLSNK
jgi:nicotinamide mononucleotide (NMN) deamidase PncC